MVVVSVVAGLRYHEFSNAGPANNLQNLIAHPGLVILQTHRETGFLQSKGSRCRPALGRSLPGSLKESCEIIRQGRRQRQRVKGSASTADIAIGWERPEKSGVAAVPVYTHFLSHQAIGRQRLLQQEGRRLSAGLFIVE